MVASFFQLNTRWTFRLLGIFALLLLWTLAFGKPFSQFFRDMTFLLRHPQDHLSQDTLSTLMARDTSTYFIPNYSRQEQLNNFFTSFSPIGHLGQALKDRTGWNLFVECHTLDAFSGFQDKHYPNLHLSIQTEAALRNLNIDTTLLKYPSIQALHELDSLQRLVITHRDNVGYVREAEAISQLSGNDHFTFLYYMEPFQSNTEMRAVPRPPQRTHLAIYYLNQSHSFLFKGQGGHVDHLQVELGGLDQAALESLLQGMRIGLLEFRETKFVNDGLKALSTAKQIDSLIIRFVDNDIDDINHQSLEHMPALPAVKAYQQDGPFFESLEPHQYQYLKQMTSLETLVFRKTTASPELMNLLPASLKQLKIVDGRISTAMITALLNSHESLNVELINCRFSIGTKPLVESLPARFMIDQAYYLSERQSRILDSQYQ